MAPPKILNILQFMGYPGDRFAALAKLKASAMVNYSGRSDLVIYVLLMNFLYTDLMVGWGKTDLEAAATLVAHMKTNHPKV